MKMGLLVIAGTGLILVALALLFYVSYNGMTEPSSAGIPVDPASFTPFQKNLAVAAKTPTAHDLENSRGLLVRSTVDAKGLLVKFSDSSEVYKYSTENKSIAPASEDDWHGGANEIACRDRQFDSTHTFLANPTKLIAVFYDPYQEMPTYGAYALRVVPSREKQLAVVLSAGGPIIKPAPGIWGFSGSGGGIGGTRYVQIVDLQNRKYLTDPVALYSIEKFPEYQFCWTDDKKFVIPYEVGDVDALQVEMDFHVIETGQ